MTVDPNLVSAGLVALVGGGGVWAYLGGKNRNKVDLVTIAQDAAEKMFTRLEALIERQDKRIEELEAQDERCRTELADLRRRIG